MAETIGDNPNLSDTDIQNLTQLSTALIAQGLGKEVDTAVGASNNAVKHNFLNTVHNSRRELEEELRRAGKIDEANKLKQVMDLTTKISEGGKEAIQSAIDSGVSSSVIQQAVAGAELDKDAKDYVKTIGDVGSFAFPGALPVKIYQRSQDAELVHDIFVTNEKDSVDGGLRALKETVRIGSNKLGATADNASRISDIVNEGTTKIKEHLDSVFDKPLMNPDDIKE